jgi:uncharacterized protein YciI
MAYFVVTNEQGPAWKSSRSLREQERWAEHAAFIDALADEGFLILAGPLGGGAKHRALLIVNSVSEQGIRERFAEDPWMRMGVLRILTIEPWEVLVGTERLDRARADITESDASGRAQNPRAVRRYH